MNLNNNKYKNYVKKTVTKMRPYIDGECMDGISVGVGITPRIGGMVACSNNDEHDLWYIDEGYFKLNFVMQDGEVSQ